MSDREVLDEATLLCGATSVYRFLLRWGGDAHWAEGMTQETIIKAWRQRHSLERSERTTAWMLSIARRVAIDDARRRGRMNELEGEALDDLPGNEINPPDREEFRDEVDRAMAAMDRLPPRQRAVMYLTAVEDLSPKEIAEVMELPASAVRSNLSVARGRLRSLLSREANEKS